MAAASGGAGGPAKGSSPLRQFAMFMAGFSLLQPLRVAVTAGSFSVSRFGVPYEKIGVFINVIHNSMETAGDFGLFIMSFYVLFGVGKSVISESLLSILSIWSLFVVNVLLLIAYTSGGEQGCLTFYYWTLVMASLGFGLDESISLTVGVTDVAYFGLGMPLSGIMVCLYHVAYLYLAKKFHWSNIDYWIVVWQIIIAVTIAGTAATTWTLAYHSEQVSENNECTKDKLSDRMKPVKSHFFMCIVGMSCIYAFYPAIAPYQFVSPQIGHKVDLVVLFVSTLSPLAIAGLCQAGVGPDQKWILKDKKNFAWWHFTWIFALPYFTIISICLIAMHYPGCRLSRGIYGNRAMVTLITVSFKFCEETLRGVSASGVGMQGKCTDGEGDGQLSALNALMAQFTMDVFSYIGTGYIKLYQRYEHDRDNWPTKYYGFWRSLGYWIGNSIKGGVKCIGESFSTDIRSNLIKNQEYLFIVYADE
ncbi:hypothetical protein BEWA_026590 [Theileria equi strain WA]|uniref:Uncharacterized protein n=1 Tax=Theileria equi strain WA TaxID=1537102 RepID=L0AW88_THEEQ|nr:hypothetical protein BEWA_026590 [Theileria equi strain WA]AFZ79810.1 hypothetical protein BEWA_026590 [Theileria equi strain WA]|eukprot:XP_004829476.1 hypothetical protein BEWA_026590 [Theileria equi strain WA]